ncbi:putative Serralysin [Sulfurovum sp. enrichment culture clone C5]|uniref:Putative Serralysin n=1 Tax=Sulfurovum sp. enrichment culture clone C5 TaxID=497650 RepID=A0A0S4XM24_9BACT|nr:putative Serralysin [Sulfurovum sp. enrichment culture clone C5]
MANYLYGKSVSDVPEADNSIINTLLYGIKWEISSIGTAINLTYSFPYTTSSTANWTSDYYYLNGEPYFTTSGLSSTQIIAAISAMQSWANVANITFTEVVENGDEVGDIRFAFSSAVEDAWGWSYLPNEYAFAGDIWISPDNDSDFSVGSYNYMALIHELGHSLGLKHPGYYGEGDEAPFLPYSTDNKQYSVMSYHDAFGNRMYENQPYYRYMWADEGTGYYVVPEAKTPMVYDILAMQYLYGANMSYHNTDDTYLFDENTAPFLMTIWDGGGNDTISVVGSVNSSIIDLNEGAYSVIQTSRFRGYDTISDKYVDNMYNLGIAYGAIIENAIGGEVNDTLTGNQVDNILEGRGGDDTIDGGAGNDTMDGGDGNDTASYQSSTLGVVVDLSKTTVQDTIGAGTDMLTNIENLTGSKYNDILIGNSENNILNGGAGIDTISYKNSTTGVTVNLATITAQNTVGAGTDTLANFENLIGSDYNDTLTGNSSNNVLEGGLGNDIINGGTGIDTVTYENSTVGVSVNLTLTSAQTIQGTEKDTITGVENLIGSDHDDILIGNSSANTINGNGGNDTLDGGAGNDILNGGDGVDTLSYATATAAIKVNLSTASAQATGGSGTDTVSNFENLIGSKYNDTLTGNNNNNTIDGGVGNDIIEGGLENDTLIGGVGVDTISYATSSQAISIDLSIEDAQDTIGAGMDTITGFENLTGSNNDDTLKGNALNNIILAGLGNDILNGGLGNDTLDGGVGIDTASYEYSNVGVTVNLALTSAQTIQGTEKDTIKNIENLTGSDYNDILKGSTLSNTINGLDGNDTIIAGTGKTNDIFDGGDGIDTISYEQATSLVTIDLSNISSQVTTGSGSDTITNFENLTGSKYNDTLNGDSNSNIILGGAGNDTINGNGGNDTLDGGAGNDIFIFDQVLSIDNIDTILNFSSVYDTIKIDDSIFDVFTNLGTILQSNLFSSIDGNALDGDDYILYNTTTGELSYDNDGSGSNAALVFATLGTTLHPTISYTDFVVI